MFTNCQLARAWRRAEREVEMSFAVELTTIRRRTNQRPPGRRVASAWTARSGDDGGPNRWPMGSVRVDRRDRVRRRTPRRDRDLRHAAHQPERLCGKDCERAWRAHD